MHEMLILKLESIVIKTLQNIYSFPDILQRLKLYEIVHSNLTENVVRNRREIFYSAVNIFKKQQVVDRLIKHLCASLNCKQTDLLVSTSLKGLYSGALEFYKNGQCVFPNASLISLIPEMSQIDEVKCKYKNCLVIEKDTIFSKIVRCYKNDDILFVCGKGYPCKNTVSLVNKLTNIKKYGIYDFDPYGIEISTKYNSVYRIGLGMEHINLIAKEYFLTLSDHDVKKINYMLKKDICREDLMYMSVHNVKIELEGLFNSKAFVLCDYFKQIFE